METDEGPLINENSNGLSHLLTEGEFNSVDAVPVDESSASNQGFLNAVEFSAGSVGDYLDNNTDSFNADSFDVGDNAVTFPSESLSNVLSDGDSLPIDPQFKATAFDTDGDVTESEKNKMDTDFEQESVSEMSSDVILEKVEQTPDKVEDENATGDVKMTESFETTNDSTVENDSEEVQRNEEVST